MTGRNGAARDGTAKETGLLKEWPPGDPKLLWKTTDLGNGYSSFKVGDHLYGTTGSAMQCLKFTTGELLWEDRALGPASMCYADNRLYLHGENGDVALVEPSSEGYRPKGRFTPPDQPPHTRGQMEKSWAYPVVANGRLCIRGHAALWCYDGRAK